MNPYHLTATVHRSSFWFNLVSFMIWQNPAVPESSPPPAPSPLPVSPPPPEDWQRRTAELEQELRAAKLKLHHWQQLETAHQNAQSELQARNQDLEQQVQMWQEQWARSQSTLSFSEERLRLALSSASMGVWYADLRTGKEHWSAESEALFGFAPGEFEGTTAAFLQRIHPEDRLYVQQRFDEACITQHYQVEYRIIWPDQTIRWLATRGRVQHDALGQPISINGVDWDISDRQHQGAERQAIAAALQQSEQLFRTVFDHAPLAIGLSTLDDHRCIRGNAAYAQMVGDNSGHSSGDHGIENLPAGSLVDHIHPDELSAYLALIAKVRAGELVNGHMETRLRHTSGQLIHAAMTLTLIRDVESTPLYELAMLEDITARKQAEAALRQSEEQFRQVFEAAPLAIGLIDLKDHRVIQSNAAHVEMTGFSRTELQHLSLVELSHPDDLAADLDRMQQLVDGVISQYQMEKRIYRKNGELLHVVLTATLMRDPLGQPLSCLGMVEDITERKRAEAQIQASLQEKEVLLKEIHHRVKNNLQIISSLLRMQSRQVQDVQTRFLFQDSQNRVQSMALIHEQLYQSADLSQINFAEYLEQLVSHLFRSYGVCRQAIALDITTHGICPTLDSAIPFGLIINELVSNSLKYAFPGPSTTRSRGYIGIQLQSLVGRTDEPPQLILTVQDNGIGIDPTLPWEQSPSLGLRIVRNLVTQLNGTIQLRSVVGTCFLMVFPGL
jgi:PAS domain S-box-containing protein